MRIVLVIDQFDDANNGTTISARRFATALKEHGNEVRVIATGKPPDYTYAVRQMKFLPLWPSRTSMSSKRPRPGPTWCIS